MIGNAELLPVHDLLLTDPPYGLELIVMRDQLWKLATAKHPEGMILPRWLLIIRTILYPLDFFYWRMSETRGYQWQSDTWNINGVRYTGAALRALAEAQGETYRITRTGECVTIERVDAVLGTDLNGGTRK